MEVEWIFVGSYVGTFLRGLAKTRRRQKLHAFPAVLLDSTYLSTSEQKGTDRDRID